MTFQVADIFDDIGTTNIIYVRSHPHARICLMLMLLPSYSTHSLFLYPGWSGCDSGLDCRNACRLVPRWREVEHAYTGQQARQRRVLLIRSLAEFFLCTRHNLSFLCLTRLRLRSVLRCTSFLFPSWAVSHQWWRSLGFHFLEYRTPSFLVFQNVLDSLVQTTVELIRACDLTSDYVANSLMLP